MALLMCLAWAAIAGFEPGPAVWDDTDTQQAPRNPPVVVAYLPNYRMAAVDPDTVELEPVTDLIYFGLSVPEEGVLALDAVPADHQRRLARIKERFGCRVLLCLGGWERSQHFAQVAHDPVRRAALVASLVELCLTHGFEGVDFDWEHPHGEREIADFALLVEETAAGFAERGLIVTFAQAGWQSLGPRVYAAADRVHLMSYDQQHPQATMAHVREEVARLIERECPAEKIALGIPFYGRNPDRAAMTYANLIQGREPAPDNDEIDGYAFNGPDTVAEKTRYALEGGLAGVMVWELTQDAPGGRSLLAAIARVLVEQAETRE